MAFFDMPLERLREYVPARTEEPDFDAFWAETLAEARSFSIGLEVSAVDYGLTSVESYDVTYNGYKGQPIKGWLLLPRHRTGPVSCVVEYIGYGGGRGFPTDWLLWPATGRACFVMDTRGQGSVWQRGDTPDLEVDGGNPHHPGYMTRGILDPGTYYYRRVFTDAVRAVEAARSHPAVDPSRIAVTGGSQGGGITLAAAGLDPTIPVAMADVPFLCHYRHATEITDGYPYAEISKYLLVHREHVERVFRTLSYFDGVNFATRAKAAALFSTGLMDETCPPSTVFAAYNHYAGPKQIEVYPYNHHEGGGPYQTLAKGKFLQAMWG